jgi:hypothetical protein
MASSLSMSHSQHLVIPGQVIATSSTSGDGNDGQHDETFFLRGHGTFVEHDAASRQDRLVASVCGTIQR